jgi:hypothetical protein
MMRRSKWLAAVLMAVMGLAGCGGSSPGAGFGAAKSGAGNYPQDAPAAEATFSGGGDAAPGQPTTQSAPAPAADAAGAVRGEFRDEVAKEPSNRPGLGTQWGETRSSHITTSPFVRADASSPFSTAALFYNDEEGARAMASASGFRRFSEGSVELGGGIATVRLKDESGRFLSGFEASGKKFVVGAAGNRYTIVIQSHVPARLEVVVSVDGLDVLDGKAASFGKRGYLIDPQGMIEIDGFRQSMDAVAAFRFGSVRDSYAEQKHGDSRNVGVIGIALFNEQGTSPSTWAIGDTQQRLDANPFPGQFATPPNR